MDAILQNLRQTLRFLRRQPGWTLTVALTLALGIGATTAIFSLVDTVLLRPLGFPNPDQLTVLWESNLESDDTRSGVAPATFTDWRRNSPTFSEMAAFSSTSFVVSDQEARSVPGMNVTPGFFRVLGVSPTRGRAFTAAEEVPGADQVVVVSHGFWMTHLGGRSDAVGSTIELSDERHTVVGILPDSFKLYENAELFTALAFKPDQLTEAMRGARYLRVIARLEDGVHLEEAREAMGVLASRLSQEHPNMAGWSVAMEPWRERWVGSSRGALLLLFSAVACVLLIACANVASLLLARNATRRREMAVRSALGAGRRRLLGQLVCESLALALIGGSLGLLVAAWCVDSADLLPWPLPRLDEVAVDARVVGFAALASLLAGLLTGLAPALAAVPSRLAVSLREAGTAALGGGSQRLRSTLVVAETAVALVLLVGAGLLLKSLLVLQSVDPGFRTSGVASVFQSLPAARYATEASRRGFVRDLLTQLDSAPAVASAAATTNPPIAGGSMNFGFSLPERPPREGDPQRVAQYHAVSPDYFRTVGIALQRGRDFEDRDRADAPPVAVVNQAMAELFWPGEDPLGRRLATHYDGKEREVVGVVGSTRHFGLDQEPAPEVYVPYAQNPWPFVHVVALSADTSSSDSVVALAPALRAAVTTIDRELPVDTITSFEEQVAVSLAPLRFQAFTVACFGLSALLLTLLGLYGVVAYSFAQRTQEVALRMAIGASRADVAWQFLRQGLVLTLSGLALGMFVALAATRFLAGFLYGVGPRDPATFAVIGGLLATVAVFACLRPAIRAARMEPMAALRCE